MDRLLILCPGWDNGRHGSISEATACGGFAGRRDPGQDLCDQLRPLRRALFRREGGNRVGRIGLDRTAAEETTPLREIALCPTTRGLWDRVVVVTA